MLFVRTLYVLVERQAHARCSQRLCKAASKLYHVSARLAWFADNIYCLISEILYCGSV